MKKIAVVLICVCCFSYVFASDIAWDDLSAGNARLKTVLVDSFNPRLIYFGSDQGVFKSKDSGRNWRNILSLRGQNRTINFLLSAQQNLYAATGNGLYFSADQGKNWRQIFKGKNDLEKECLALAVSSDTLYLGTSQGLFVSRDKGRLWSRGQGNIGKSQILAIVCDSSPSGYIYLTCTDGVFRSKDAGKNWERIFVASPAEEENGDTENNADEDSAQQSSEIRYLALDPDNPTHLYLATSHGVYKTQDQGQTWQALSDYGLLNKEVRFLLVSARSELYAASKSGIFRYDRDRWQELSFALEAGEIKSLSLDKQDNLYAAADKGLFKANLKYLSADREENIIAAYSKDEPQINEIQQAAVRYAEVEPEKIARWRRQAAKRAFLPKVTVGMDTDRNRTTSNSIWGTYPSNGTPGRYYVGPDDETRYNNNNWNVSLTWELGDLIWNDDQTNIDVRSRLMVELRDDILDEVTKAYFERLRVKMELDNLAIEERKKRSEKELRLQELTASLDALTGGYFSQQLKLKTGS